MKVETLDAVLRLDVDEGEPVRDIGRYAIKEGKCVSRRFVELGIMGYLQSWWMDEWAEESGNNGRFGVATTPEIPGMLGHVSLTKDASASDTSVRRERYVTSGMPCSSAQVASNLPRFGS